MRNALLTQADSFPELLLAYCLILFNPLLDQCHSDSLPKNTGEEQASWIILARRPQGKEIKEAEKARSRKKAMQSKATRYAWTSDQNQYGISGNLFIVDVISIDYLISLATQVIMWVFMRMIRPVLVGVGMHNTGWRQLTRWMSVATL